MKVASARSVLLMSAKAGLMGSAMLILGDLYQRFELFERHQEHRFHLRHRGREIRLRRAVDAAELDVDAVIGADGDNRLVLFGWLDLRQQGLSRFRLLGIAVGAFMRRLDVDTVFRSEEHTSELQS